MSRFIQYFFLIVYSSFLFNFSFGQETVTIGNGTSAQAQPLGIYFGYERSAAIYTSAEISPPKTILRLAWYVSGTNGANIPTKIYLKKTTASTLTASTWDNMITGATLVYEGSLQCAASGWKTVEINQFNYDEDNLLVLCETNYGGSGTSSYPTFYYTAATSQHQQWREDSNPPTGTGTVNNNRPNIQISFSTVDMSFVSATTEQTNTSKVLVGDTNQEIIRLKIVTDGSLNPIAVNSISFSTNGSTSTADIQNAKVYYTSGETFSTTTQFGTTVNNPNGTFTVEGNQVLSYSNNYFWLAYDISNSATVGNFVDGECTQFTTSEPGELVRIPTEQAPPGNREIKSALNGTYTISNPGGHFQSLNEAIDQLNQVGVSGNVVFNIPAGESFNEAGNLNITVSGAADKTITFQKQGEGAKPIFNFTGTNSNADACIKLSGSDYIILDGLDIRNAGNNSDNYVEYGFYFVGGTTGCQYNIIENCEITLTRDVTSRGVYTESGATSISTGNSNNKFLNNTLRDCVYGYYLKGAGNEDRNNEIGTINDGESILTNIEKTGMHLEYQVDFNIHNNEVIINSQSNYFYGIYVSFGSNNSGNIYENNIHSLSSSYSNCYGYGISVAYAGSINIYKNRVHSSTVSDGRLVGIYCMYPTNISVFKNKIYDLKNESSEWRSIVGIELGSDIQNGNIYNNFIYGLSAPASPNTTVKGILATGSYSNYYIFHNTVYLSFESTNSSNIISGIYTSNSPTKIDLRNNIITTKISGTYSKSIAHYRSSTNYSNLSADGDNNIYYAGVPSSSNIIFYNGITDYQTLTDYKTAMANKDQNSMTEDVPFVSTSDPHIQLGIQTMVKGKGKKFTTPFQVTDDIDNEIRNANYPDIGADAGDFSGIDTDGPIIEYNALLNTSSLEDRTLSVTIDDMSGINTTSSKPRIYFKKTTNANAFIDNTNSSDGWKYTETNSTNSPFEFTIDYSLINDGVAATEIIQYFVVAQDIISTPNVSINSGTPNTSLTGVNLSPDNFPIGGTINQYLIIGLMSGTYTVGAGGNYTTLTEAINDLNSKYLSGPVHFSLIDNSYPSETFPIVINANAYSSETNTITIKPAAGKTPVFSGSSTNSAIFKLNGVDYITIDGSNQSNGADRSMTIANTYLGTVAGIWLVGKTAGTGCNNVTIKNCVITTGSNSGSYYYGISVSSDNIGVAGFDNDNITIYNNDISKCTYGIYAVGSSSGVYNNLTITENIIGSDNSASYISRHGMWLSYCEDINIGGNTVKNISAGYSGLIAVVLSTGIKNCVFEKNLIRGTRTSISGYGTCAISISPGNNPSNITFRNNIIYGVTGQGNTNPGSNGNAAIRLLSGSGIQFYYNSVNMYGNISRSSAVSDNSAAIYISNNASDITLKNNIFKNSLVNTTGVSTAWGIYSDATMDKFTAIDYNDYFGGESQGKLGYRGEPRLTIEAWRTATGQDAHSLNVNPYFSSNLNLLVPNYSQLKNAGVPIAGIESDYSGNPRNETHPWIGAYETGYDPALISWCNIKTPGSFSKGKGTLGFTILAQVFIDAVTTGAGATADLDAYIGYSTADTDPSTWSNWTPATFNVQDGDNDEFKVTLGENFAVGNYYYAAKFVYKGGTPVYGGYSSGGGGIWGDGNSSGVLTVTDALISWCNLNNPATVTQNEGGTFEVSGKVYSDGVTTLAGEQPGLKAWVGWNYVSSNPSSWNENRWTEASFSSEDGDNDIYNAVIGADIQSGTAYFATRFQLLDDSFVYGGYSTDGGGIWDGTNKISGVATVNEKIVTAYPFFEGMEQGILPPAGWRDESENWQMASNTYEGDWGLGIDYNLSGTIVTNKFTLSNNLQISFWWIDDDPFIGLPKSSIGKTGGIETTPYDNTYFEITTNNGESWTTLADLSDQDISEFEKYTRDLSDYSGKTVKFRFRNVSDGSEDAWGFIVDNIKIKRIPSNSATNTLNNYWNTYTFLNTGVTINSSDNSDSFSLIVSKIDALPGGTLPGTLTNFAPYYWDFEVTGYLDEDYSCNLTLDLSGLQGVNDFSTLHLLHRENPNEPWIDLGVASSVEGGICTWNIEGFSEFVIASDDTNPLPVELSSFTAVVNKRDINLAWKTETEINTALFILERKDEDDEWKTISELKAAGNSNSTKEYSFIDRKLNSGSYSYRLKMIDTDGSYKYSNSVESVIDLPMYYDLSQNYPNPFNPVTTINYQLPSDSKVLLELYSITGEKVATIIDEDQVAGYYNYQLSINRFKLSSGVYLYKMSAGDFTSIKKMMVLK
jgi:hypothetical protein